MLVKVLNLIWGFTQGGVGKCFLTYCDVGDVEPALDLVSVCVNLENTQADVEQLYRKGVRIIGIRNRCDFSWIKRINALIDEECPDLIFTHGFNGPVVVMICRLFGGKKIPMVCSYHSEYHPMTMVRRPLAPLLNSLVHYIYCHFCYAILGVSDFNLKFLRAKGVPQRKLHFVHNGIVDLNETPTMPTDFPIFENGSIKFLVASRLDRVKGLTSLIKAFFVATKKYGNITLLIVGDGPVRHELECLVTQEGFGNEIKFFGMRSDVANWMSCCDVFCLTSFIESFPIGLIEAMRAAKPSIVSNVGGIPEAVTSSETIFVRPGDPDSIAEAIETLASDEKLRQRMGSAARKRYLENFTEEKMKRGIADWLLKCGREHE